jgi:translation initiation factor 1
MSKKNIPDSKGFVYSTDPNFSFEEERNDLQTLSVSQQKLRLRLDTKQRAGKVVTLIIGFIGNTEDAESLGKQLKNLCGTGGSVKDNEILVQGDHRDKILQWLLKNGYTGSKKI